MTFKSILVHVQASDSAERLSCAVDLAKRFKATLVGLGAQGIPPSLTTGPLGLTLGPVMAELFEQVEHDLAAAEARFRREATGVDCEWRVGRGAPTLYLASCSAMADLVLISRATDLELNGLRSVDPGEAILSTGRPLLFVPDGRDRLVPDTVLIAWKNTREARRAVSDSLPFLVEAKQVVLLAVCPEPERERVAATVRDVASYLGLHGVQTQPVWADSADDRAIDAINAHAGQINADLIVTGGYGHSRMGEWVFGGVTRSLLRHSDRFVLFSH